MPLFGFECLDVASELFELAFLLIAHLVGVAAGVPGRLCWFFRWLLRVLGRLLRPGCRSVFAPVAILRVVAWEILYASFAVKHQQVVDHLVGEVAVVAHYDDAAREVLQVFLEHLQRLYVEVVGRLVEYEEVGVAHEHRA